MHRHGRLTGGAAALVLFAACAAPGGAPSGSDQNRVSPGDVRLILTTDRAEYRPGETVTAQMVVANDGRERVTLEFRDGQRYDLTLVNSAGATVWRWAVDKGFIQVIGEEILEPAGELRYQESFSAPAAGSYRLIGTITAMAGVLADTVSLTVRP